MYATTLFVVLGLCATALVNAIPVSHPFSHNAFSKRAGNGKAVFAHFMMGNAFPYTQQDFEDDVKLASASGIDAFALNIGTDDWQPGHVKMAYDAAAASGTGFKMFISFDMTVLPCGSPADAAALRNYVTTYADHPAQFKYDGRVFASTFSGEKCSFGSGSPQNGWKSQFYSQLNGNVFFVPALFADPGSFPSWSGAMDGVFNWNAGWPVDLTSSKVSSILGGVGLHLGPLVKAALNTASQTLAKFVGSTDSDQSCINGLKGLSASGAKAYMTSVSPWFFTHYGADSFNKNFIYYADSHLYNTRWESVIQNRDEFDLVEVLTWNDYGESHYIAPVKGAQPNSQAWVDGNAHDGWLDMTNYYATAFKTGKYPEIAQDALYAWARPTSTNANAPDPVGKPTNADTMTDAMWVAVFSTAPGTVTLSSGNGNSQDFIVQPGVTKLQLPLTPGSTMHATLTHLQLQRFRCVR
ncbi:unnamed protein product [Somion occarium]|uniref:Glycoside hydrolase family 71 protein n=1 Tax=Somion occarium TaxID=3059160 RepID=A0ABP1E1I2_9APHY